MGFLWEFLYIPSICPSIWLFLLPPKARARSREDWARTGKPRSLRVYAKLYEDLQGLAEGDVHLELFQQPLGNQEAS